VRDLGAEWVLARTPGSVSRSVGTGNDHDIAVRIPHPALPVIRPAVTIWRVSMTGYDNLDAHFGRALDDRVKVVDLEP
jgi:hypothetical protein